MSFWRLNWWNAWDGVMPYILNTWQDLTGFLNRDRSVSERLFLVQRLPRPLNAGNKFSKRCYRVAIRPSPLITFVSCWCFMFGHSDKGRESTYGPAVIWRANSTLTTTWSSCQDDLFRGCGSKLFGRSQTTSLWEKHRKLQSIAPLLVPVSVTVVAAAAQPPLCCWCSRWVLVFFLTQPVSN